MTPVYQTIFGSYAAKGAERGNCMQATAATLFGKKLEEVPHFMSFDAYEDEWWDKYTEFLHEQGYYYHGYLANHNRHGIDAETYEPLYAISIDDGVNGLFEATVFSPGHFDEEIYRFDPSARQVCHAVLCDINFNIVHDPNPKYKGLEKYPTADEIGYNGILGIYQFRNII